MRDNYSKDDIIEKFNFLAKNLGRLPTLKDMHKHFGITTKIVYKHFNSVKDLHKEALKVGGLDIIRPKDKILADFKRLVDDLGRIPYVKELKDFGLSYYAILSHFGSYESLCNELCLTLGKRKRTQWTRGNIKRVFLSVVNDIGGIPLILDLPKYGLHYSLICRHFGSYENLCKEVGLEYTRGKRKYRK